TEAIDEPAILIEFYRAILGHFYDPAEKGSSSGGRGPPATGDQAAGMGRVDDEAGFHQPPFPGKDRHAVSGKDTEQCPPFLQFGHRPPLNPIHQLPAYRVSTSHRPLLQIGKFISSP